MTIDFHFRFRTRYNLVVEGAGQVMLGPTVEGRALIVHEGDITAAAVS
jgi:mannose-6-phosphate isomerase-like protein (cupin superfamily)